ncbi:hypothetical protein N7508_004396 [Penicillium antarcticum]|uniref:uncharacterized protein n=1 Tax=Penicillium antarcticum TaxID=416450 RepID=UPI0023A5EA45|nr:uncharacterized protein N7508_004396 [Penicillium antarcticum]KAJ5309017.1 hypothetical protein N7508_004396 [Penicillium antarcticum]
MSDDNTRRHWHGNPGDRHEHHNVWMNGGAKGPSSRAAWAMPEGTISDRRDSTTSTSSNNNSNTNASPSIPSLSDRRRSSASSSGGGLFANLQSQKRESNTSADMANRRASWAEQASKGGAFSKWWDGYTRGTK